MAAAAVADRVGTSLSWLGSHVWLPSTSIFNASLVPFLDTQSSLASRQTASFPQSDLSQQHQGAGLEDSDGETVSWDMSESPWGFVASRYALTLSIVAVVVNRITHICRPQGRPRPLPTHRRLMIQIPTLLFLSFSALILALTTAQSLLPSSELPKQLASFLRVPEYAKILLSDSASHSEMHAANATLLWHLFLSVCVAVLSSTLLRTLEGLTNSLNPDDYASSPTFNLVGFAVLLHLHATSQSFPPNKHVWLTILFQVGEVLGLQICTVFREPPISRLSLTTFFGLTSTLHYLLAVRSGDMGYPFLQTFSRAPDVALISIILLTLSLHALTTLLTDTPLSFQGLLDPRAVPSPSDDYSLALFKLGTACLSSTRLSGLDADLIDITTASETWVEVRGSSVVVREVDGSIASPDAGLMGGLGREIRRIKSARPDDFEQPSYFSSSARVRAAWTFIKTLFGTLAALAKMAGRKFMRAMPFDLPRTPRWIRRPIRRLPRNLRLLWHGTTGEERRRTRLQEARRQAERQSEARRKMQEERSRREGAGRAIGSSSALASLSSSTASSTGGLRSRRAISPIDEATSSSSWFGFFSRDENFVEDEQDDDWEEGEEDPQAERDMRSDPANTDRDYWNGLGQGSRLQDNDLGAESEDEEDEWEDDDDASKETERVDGAELLSLAQTDIADEDFSNVLMAHLSRNAQQGALTRRGYHQLISGQTRAEEEASRLIDIIRERRAVPSAHSSGNDSERERMRLCVICYIEDRTIICWPCRCLALCDDCRMAIVTRPPPRHFENAFESSQARPTHTCPTCRTPVTGFSRIYSP